MLMYGIEQHSLFMTSGLHPIPMAAAQSCFFSGLLKFCRRGIRVNLLSRDL